MNILEKNVSKRQLFVTMGCAKFPYERIKELAKDREKLTYKDIMNLAIQDDEKVVTIQELDYFGEPMMRLLAYRYAEQTVNGLRHLLDAEGLKLVEESIGFLNLFIWGEATHSDIREKQTQLRNYIQTVLHPLGTETGEQKARFACVEVILSVMKNKAYHAMKESSSILRDLLGAEMAVWQLRIIAQMAENLYDRNPNP